MSQITYTPKSQQQIESLFDGKFIENKPIPFPNLTPTKAYSNLFYWAHLEALETGAFPLHPHKGFEIMSFVIKGSLEHFDTATNVWTPLGEGGVQVIQARSGVEHAERITKGSEFFQIWFDPDFSQTLYKSAQYKDYPKEHFHPIHEAGITTTEYISKNAPIEHETQGIRIAKVDFDAGSYTLDISYDETCSIYIIKGHGVINEHEVQKDGFMILKGSDQLHIQANESLEIFTIQSPSIIPYRRYIDR